MDMETGVKPQASVSTLSMTLGLFALGIAWRNAAKMFSIPPAIGETILLLTGCLWLFLLSRYIHQILSSSNGVSRELLLQLQNPFLTLIPITTGLASVALHPYASLPAHILLFIGVAGQLLFSSYHVSEQWHGNTPSEMETPACTCRRSAQTSPQPSRSGPSATRTGAMCSSVPASSRG